MADLYDSTDPANIPDGVNVMYYIDGKESAWPSDQVARFAGQATVSMSVLGNAGAAVFDSETGNAPLSDVVTACARRFDAGLWSVVYCTKGGMPGVVTAVRGKSLPLLPASSWPQKGVYLHVADPTGTPHLTVAGAPVQPVAVQDRWDGNYDISSCYGTYPALPAPPAPPATPPAPPVTIVSPAMQLSPSDPTCVDYLSNGTNTYILWQDGSLWCVRGAPPEPCGALGQEYWVNADTGRPRVAARLVVRAESGPNGVTIVDTAGLFYDYPA